MRPLRAWCLRVIGMFLRARRERDLADELECHIQMHVKDGLRSGLSAEAARRRAVIELGGLEQTKENVRAARAAPFDILRQDLLFALRVIHRSPTVALVAVVSLALGIGANTAIFSVLNAVVLKPLPFENADRLCMVWETFRTTERGSVSYLNLEDWHAQNRVFESLGGFFLKSHTLTGPGEPERLSGGRVTSGFFATLQVQPALGRVFGPSDDRLGAENVAILTHSSWQRRFGGDPRIVGRALTIDQVPFRVVGVLRPDFHFGVGLEETEVFTPTATDAVSHKVRGWPRLRVVARLRPAATIEQAQAQMNQTQRWLADEYPESSRGHSIRVVPLHEEVVGRVRPVLLLLLGAVGLVLLAACANVANLLMARGAARTREFAIRAALGAGRPRVVRQLLTESLLIGVIGGVAGFLVAFWSLNSLVALLPPDMPRVDSIRIDLRVLLFSLGVSVATSVFFGLAPALHASRVAEHPTLRDSGAGLGISVRHAVRAGLVVVQVALAVTLLVGGGLMARSMARLTRVAPGFRVDHLLTFRVNLGWEHRSTSRDRVDLYTRVLGRLKVLPGVESVSASSTLPMGPIEGYRFTIEGRPVPAAKADWPESRLSSISSGYFATMGIPLLRGRLFDDGDQRDSRPGAVIVNEALARAYFPGEDPLGKRITSEVDINDTDPKVFQVVGIVGDDHARGLDVPEEPCLYSPYRQQTFPYMSFALRTSVEPASLAAAVRKAVAEETATEAIYQMATAEQLLGRSRGLVSRRFPMILLGLFAGLATVLATTGLYGVLSFVVVQRTREIGQRMSLGATPRDVQRMMLRQGMALVAGGLAAGLAVSLAASRLLRSLLFETSPWDPVAIGAVAAFVVLVAFCACYFPARRAARVDPMVTLRCA